METMNARYKAKTNKTGSRIDMENPELPIELSQMIIWVMHHEDDAMHLLPEYNKIRQQAEERDEGSAKSAAMICETCKYQHTSEDVYVWPCKHCTPDDRRYEKAQAHYPEEWGPSDNRRLTCVCGDPDPFHATKTPNVKFSSGVLDAEKNTAGSPSAGTDG